MMTPMGSVFKANSQTAAYQSILKVVHSASTIHLSALVLARDSDLCTVDGNVARAGGGMLRTKSA
jgi:hypothetical protein